MTKEILQSGPETTPVAAPPDPFDLNNLVVDQSYVQGLMIHFDPEALTDMQMAEALLQLLFDIVWVEERYRGAKSMLHLVSKGRVGSLLVC